MNEDEIRDWLAGGIPTPPSSARWAGKAAGRVRQRRMLTGAAALMVAVALPVGFMLNRNNPITATPQPAETITAATELSGAAMILQEAGADLPHLCLGAIRETYPPQCDGPTLKGGFSWQDLDADSFTNEGGTRWTMGRHLLQGFYDPDDGDWGSFTLSQPASADRVVIAAVGILLPSVCDDPFSDVEADRTGPLDQEALARAAERLPLVGMWVSDLGEWTSAETSYYNVLVRGDAESARDQLREVWGGGLCAASSDAATVTERQEAMARITDVHTPKQVLATHDDAPKQQVVVDVVVETTALRASILAAASDGVDVRLAPVFTPVEQASPTPTADATADPDGRVELVGNATMIIQRAGEPTRLCLGLILQSLPPGCAGGPELKGDFSWDDVEHEFVSDVRWTEAAHTLHGYYDPGDGEFGSFTLTRPVTPALPATQDPGPEYTQLCDDPLRGADPTKTDVEDMNAFSAVAEQLPVVGLWVSNGLNAYNVLINGDVEEAYNALRAVWGGELCVQASDAPTEADRLAAMTRAQNALPPNQFLGGSFGLPMDPTVEVDLIATDDALEAIVHHAVGDGFDVRITSVFSPVAAPSPTSEAPAGPSATDGETPDDPDQTMDFGLDPIWGIPAEKLAAHGTPVIAWYDDEGAPRICPFGDPSYDDLLTEHPAARPPYSRCAGPVLKGEFTWDELPTQPRSGLRILSGYEVQGSFDLSDGPDGSFTLSTPPVPAKIISGPAPLPSGASVTIEDHRASASRIMQLTPSVVRVPDQADGQLIIEVPFLTTDVSTAIRNALRPGISAIVQGALARQGQMTTEFVEPSQ